MQVLDQNSIKCQWGFDLAHGGSGSLQRGGAGMAVPCAGWVAIRTLQRDGARYSVTHPGSNAMGSAAKEGGVESLVRLTRYIG